jgi:hypothetical protein
VILRLIVGGIMAVLGLGIFADGLASGETAGTVIGPCVALVGIAIAIGPRGRS